MDKETLSNYGWIVILVLILAVMIALATPFGNFIAGAIKSTTAGFFSVNQNAMNAGGITIPGQNFDDTSSDDTNETGYKFGDAIDQGDYRFVYYGCASVEDFREGYFKAAANSTTEFGYGPICKTEDEALEHISPVLFGCTWEEAQAQGYTAEIISEMLNIEVVYENNKKEGRFENGWQVYVIDNTKSTYEDIPAYVENIPVFNLTSTFQDCKSLTKAPIIPNTVTIMTQTFSGCTSLTETPIIPENVINLYRTFYGCTSLTETPIIPENVINLYCTFYGCTSLSGTVTINTNSITTTSGDNNTCYKCFQGVDMSKITLTGSASKDVLNLIGSTGNNWTPIP